MARQRMDIYLVFGKTGRDPDHGYQKRRQFRLVPAGLPLCGRLARRRPTGPVRHAVRRLCLRGGRRRDHHRFRGREEAAGVRRRHSHRRPFAGQRRLLGGQAGRLQHLVYPNALFAPEQRCNACSAYYAAPARARPCGLSARTRTKVVGGAANSGAGRGWNHALAGNIQCRHCGTHGGPGPLRLPCPIHATSFARRRSHVQA